MKTLAIIAIAASTALTALPSASAAMDGGLSQIERSAARTLARHGFSVDVQSLSLGQIAEIAKIRTGRGEPRIVGQNAIRAALGR